VGNAIKPGINVIAPMVEEIRTPKKPELLPINFDITWVLRTAIKIPTKNITPRRSGNMFSKDFQAFINDLFVFSLLLKKDMIKNIMQTRYKNPLKI